MTTRSSALGARSQNAEYQSGARERCDRIKDPRRVNSVAGKATHAERVAGFSDKLADAFVRPGGVRFLAASPREED